MKYLIFILLCYGSTALGGSYIDNSFARAAKKAGVPEQLLRAICYSESRYQPRAFRFGDGGDRNHAIGICQLLVSTASSFVGHDPKCHRDFRDRSIPRAYQECKLFGPYTNILAAALYLKSHLKRYDGSWINAIAAYNSGKPRPCPRRGYFYYWTWSKKLNKLIRATKSCQPGTLMNHDYVDRVLHALHKGK